MNYDSIVVGAGIVGSACALELAQAGMRVALVDPSGPGLGATAAGMGHIVVMDDSPAQLLLTEYSRDLWDLLSAELPAACEFRRTGTLWIAADEAEMEEVERKRALYAERGLAASVFSAEMLRVAEPALRKDLQGALEVPGDSVVYAPAVARVLAERACALGAAIVKEQVAAMGGGRVRLASGGELRSQRIINAAGEWAGALTPGLPIKRRKGHLAITDRYPGLVRHQLVELGYLKSAHATTEDSVAFNVQPRSTGQLLIGSSRQFEAEESGVQQGILSRMLERAVWYVPGLGELSVLRLWTGFRAATPDKLPLIGAWPGDDTVYLATGHEGLGITTSLGTAKLLANWLNGQEPALPMDAYAPGRSMAGGMHA
jgi:glycine/D-amino acid oxidase-like deaminating enzyme